MINEFSDVAEWPSFPDGQLISIGDEFFTRCVNAEGGVVRQVTSISFHPEGFRLHYQSLGPEDYVSYDYGVHPNRPPLYSKDGEVISTYDIGQVFYGENGMRWQVIGISWPDYPYVIEGKDIDEVLPWENRTEDPDAPSSPAIRQLKPEWLTKVKPDSWEQIEEDCKKWRCEYFGRKIGACATGTRCPALDYKSDNNSPCEEFQRLDILRRCKALAAK